MFKVDCKHSKHIFKFKIYIYIYFENGSFRENDEYHVKVCSALHLEQQLFHAINS